MNDLAPKTPFISARRQAREAQIRNLLSGVSETLYLLYKSDQRMGVKILYRDENFNSAIRKYFNAVYVAQNESMEKEQIDNVLFGASAFIDYVQTRYEKYRSRMLTTLRQDVGASFSLLYKNTIILKKFLKSDLKMI